MQKDQDIPPPPHTAPGALLEGLGGTRKHTELEKWRPPHPTVLMGETETLPPGLRFQVFDSSPGLCLVPQASAPPPRPAPSSQALLCRGYLWPVCPRVPSPLAKHICYSFLYTLQFVCLWVLPSSFFTG